MAVERTPRGLSQASIIVQENKTAIYSLWKLSQKHAEDEDIFIQEYLLKFLLRTERIYGAEAVTGSHLSRPPSSAGKKPHSAWPGPRGRGPVSPQLPPETHGISSKGAGQ